jgi:hypothetical protein
MDFHLNRKVALSQESKYQSLYKWSLQEHDDDGKQFGDDQVPWNWSVVFAATEMELNEELELEVKTAHLPRDRPAGGISRCWSGGHRAC